MDAYQRRSDLGTHGSRSLVDVGPAIAIVPPAGGGDVARTFEISLELLARRVPPPSVALDGNAEIGPRAVQPDPSAIGHHDLVLQHGLRDGHDSMSRKRSSSSRLSMPLGGRLDRTTARSTAVPRRPRLPTRSRMQIRSTAERALRMMAS